MDNMFIRGTMQNEHNETLRKALSRQQEAKVTVNDKCEFSKSKIKFLGQIIEVSGIRTDPGKVSTVQAMKEPCNVSEVRLFLGMTNNLWKFLPHLAEKTHPLRDLLQKSMCVMICHCLSLQLTPHLPSFSHSHTCRPFPAIPPAFKPLLHCQSLLDYFELHAWLSCTIFLLLYCSRSVSFACSLSGFVCSTFCPWTSP